MNMKEVFEHGIVLGRLLEKAYYETKHTYLECKTQEKIDSIRQEIEVYKKKFDDEFTSMPEGLSHNESTNTLSGTVE